MVFEMARSQQLFVTLDRVRPFDPELNTSLGFDNYVSMLGLDDTWNLWSSRHQPSLFVDLVDREDNDKLSLLISGKADEVFTEQQGAYAGGDAIAGVIGSLSSDFTRSLTFLAVGSLLSGFEARIARLRDALRILSQESRSAVKTLSRVQREVIGAAADVAPIAAELVALLGGTHPYSGIEFTPAPQNRVREPGTRLLATTARYYRRRARLLLDAERHTRELFIATSNVSAATESMRVNGRLVVLTFVAAVAAALLIWDRVHEIFGL
jgi:hypothetical protein